MAFRKFIKKITGTDIPNFCRHIWRIHLSKDIVKKRVQDKRFVNLSKKQRSDVHIFWKKYVSHIDYSSFIFYNAFCTNNKTLKYYIPEEIYYPIIDMYFSNAFYASVYDNKNIYDLYFNDVPQAKTIIRYVNGVFLNDNYEIITKENAFFLCKKFEKIILKPAIDSEGGRGILFLENTSENIDQQLATYFAANKNVIVQEIVQQHVVLNSIHKDSLNTIRIITLLLNNEIYPLSSILRMGRNGKKVDNASSGGVFCGINEDGSLKRMTYDCQGNSYDGHPNGTKIEGIILPNFTSAKELVKRLVPRVMHISSLCSWDLALDENGEYKLIEVNMSFGQLDFHQICNGPLFGDKTEEILELVFSKSPNKKTHL